MKKMIQTLESQIIENPKAEDSDKILPLMAAKRNEMRQQFIKIEKRTKEIEHQIAVYQERIEKTPNTGQELLDLNRNYSNIRGQYNSLLSRKLESEIAVNMEKKQKGEQFKIIDPAKMPEKPYEPDLEKLFFLVMVAGLGVGAALIVLMEYFDTAFRRAEEIEPYLKVPVLAYVPKITTKAELRKQRIGRVFGLVPIAGTALLLGIFMITTIKADENTLKIIEKLGILKAIDIFNEFLRAI